MNATPHSVTILSTGRYACQPACAPTLPTGTFYLDDPDYPYKLCVVCGGEYVVRKKRVAT